MMKRGLLLSIFLVFVLIYSSGFVVAAWTSNLNENLWGYFTFNETSGSNVPNVFNASLNAVFINAADTSWVPGLFGNSIKLNGTNQAINFTDPIFDSNDFTIAWWENRTSADCTKSPASWGYVLSTIPQPFQFWCNIDFNYMTLAASSNGISWDIISPDGTMNCGSPSVEPTYWALTRVGNNWTCYKNGIIMDSVIGSGTLWNSNKNLLFGKVQSGQYYDGQVDEIGIWKGRGFNTSEILQVYNNGYGITYSSLQNETNETFTTNQSGFWTLDGTKLYPSNSSYSIGIGINNNLQLGTQDAFGRNQIWNFLPFSVLRLGSLGSDGDAQTVPSEGIVVYGNNSHDDAMSPANFSYARIKPNRIGLYTSFNDVADYYFRVDPTSLFLKDDSFTKTFEVTRETGLVNTNAGYSINGQAGITDNTNFWMCKDSTCSTTCQVDIQGGIIIGCI